MDRTLDSPRRERHNPVPCFRLYDRPGFGTRLDLGYSRKIVRGIPELNTATKSFEPHPALLDCTSESAGSPLQCAAAVRFPKCSQLRLEGCESPVRFLSLPRSMPERIHYSAAAGAPCEAMDLRTDFPRDRAAGRRRRGARTLLPPWPRGFCDRR